MAIEYPWRSPLWYLHLDDLDEWNNHGYTGDKIHVKFLIHKSTCHLRCNFYPSKLGDGNSVVVELVVESGLGHHEFTDENCDVTYTVLQDGLPKYVLS